LLRPNLVYSKRHTTSICTSFPFAHAKTTNQLYTLIGGYADPNLFCDSIGSSIFMHPFSNWFFY